MGNGHIRYEYLGTGHYLSLGGGGLEGDHLMFLENKRGDQS